MQKRLPRKPSSIVVYSPFRFNKTKPKRYINWHFNFNNLDIDDIDHDKKRNWKDCQPFNPKRQDSAEFNRAKKHFGTTTDPHKSAWILPSGEMLDFSNENLKRLYKEPGRSETTGDEQIAHWEIGKVTQLHGNAAIRAFEKEGAIRFRKSVGKGMYAEMVKRPTAEQARILARAIETEPRPKFLVIEKVPPNIKVLKPEQREYLVEEKENPHPVIIQRFISRAFQEKKK